MNRKQGFRGKYCVVCNYVWEWDPVQHTQVKYEGLPTYGLERAYCFNCKKEQVHIPNTLVEEIEE
jgi:hypothetical protein